MDSVLVKKLYHVLILRVNICIYIYISQCITVLPLRTIVIKRIQGVVQVFSIEYGMTW